MQCLIDLDIVLYEIAFNGQYKDEGEGDVILLRSFDYVAEKLDEKIKQIEDECWATEPSILYITGKTNFRNGIAKRRPYKEKRSPKPFHHANLKAYAKAKYDVRMQEGLEADDLLAIEQSSRDDTIICTRDKDLRMVGGMHFGWECGKQPQFGPRYVSNTGTLELKNGKKIVGDGLLFFYSQLITGDSVDTIPGLSGGGPVMAYKSLHGAKTEQEMFTAVSDLYKGKYPETWEEELLEQARLLWMVRELKDGEPVMWEFPNED
jgi:5'-3' exonuclease